MATEHQQNRWIGALTYQGNLKDYVDYHTGC